MSPHCTWVPIRYLRNRPIARSPYQRRVSLARCPARELCGHLPRYDSSHTRFCVPHAAFGGLVGSFSKPFFLLLLALLDLFPPSPIYKPEHHPTATMCGIFACHRYVTLSFSLTFYLLVRASEWGATASTVPCCPSIALRTRRAVTSLNRLTSRP